MGGVGKMIKFYAKKGWHISDILVWQQTGWVGSKKVKILDTYYMNGS